MTSATSIQALHDRAEVFKALGHEDRLRIVTELATSERCVCDLVKAVGSSWSTVSRHLSVLKAAGIVADEKRGLQVFYRLALPCVHTFLDCLDRADAERPAGRRCSCRTN